MVATKLYSGTRPCGSRYVHRIIIQLSSEMRAGATRREAIALGARSTLLIRGIGEPIVREVAGFPGYLVSSSGDVYSTRQGYPLKLVARPHKGYLHVQIKTGVGKATQRKVPVHQVVLFAYGPPRPSPLHGGRHLNGDATNNHSTNLAWGTQAQNIQDAIDHGTHVSVRSRRAATPPQGGFLLAQ